MGVVVRLLVSLSLRMVSTAPQGVTPQAKLNKPQYLSMIRNREEGTAKAEPGDVSDSCCGQNDGDDSRLVIQIHGSTSDPQSIVLTREGYRSLLHLNPAYSNFLKTVMAGSTLLYMGFSFTDGYFNEIRSELMTLQVRGPWPLCPLLHGAVAMLLIARDVLHAVKVRVHQTTRADHQTLGPK